MTIFISIIYHILLIYSNIVYPQILPYYILISCLVLIVFLSSWMNDRRSTFSLPNRKPMYPPPSYPWDGDLPPLSAQPRRRKLAPASPRRIPFCPLPPPEPSPSDTSISPPDNYSSPPLVHGCATHPSTWPQADAQLPSQHHNTTNGAEESSNSTYTTRLPYPYPSMSPIKNNTAPITDRKKSTKRRDR